MSTRRGRKRTRHSETPTKASQDDHEQNITSHVVTKITKATTKSTSTAATTTAAPSKSTTVAVPTTATNSESTTLPVEIKLEVLDEDEVAHEFSTPPDDTKPDVLELQQQLLRLQQQQQQQPQQQTLPLQTAAALLPATGKPQVFIISDMTTGLTLTPLNASGVLLKNGGNFENATTLTEGNIVAAAGCGIGAGAVPSTGVGIGGTGGAKRVGKGVHVSAVVNNYGSNATTAATSSMTSAAKTTTPSKFLDDAFEADEFDLQESDTDEEGYSDIDLDEEDELVEDDDEIDLYDPVWTYTPTEPRMVFPFNTPQADVGLEGRPKSTNPIFYFDKILGNREEFFRKLAISSNERARELVSANNVGQTYLKQITPDEMQTFFGLCLQLSSLKLNTLADYWNEQAHYGFRGFRNKMSLNRFQMLLRVLNFEQFEPAPPANSTNTERPKEALAELQPLLNFFNQRMATIYKVGQRLVLNEPLMFWKGRLHWVRDLSEKFRCNAVLLHFLTEQTGLVLKIVPDVERLERKQHVRNSKLLVVQRVVIAKELLKGKLRKGHTVYASKYYGSYGLAYELGYQETYCTGLLDYKRYGNCKQLILTNLEKNSFETKYAASIMMGKWRRKEKCIYFYSSDCLAINPKETSTHIVDPRPKLIKEVDWQLKPPVKVRDYMVDYQPTLQRQDIKWDKQLAIYVFNLTVLNAYIMYTMYAQFGRARILELHLKDISKLKNYAEFRHEVIASLLHMNESTEDERARMPKRTWAKSNATTDDDDDEEGESMQNQTAASAAQKQLLEAQHMPMLIPRRKGKVMKKKCRVCRKGGMLTFSKLCCEVCPGMPGLCETPCFKIFHDQLKKSLKAGERIKTRTFGKSGEKTIYL